MSEICASRVTATGKEQVLVLWRPTWEPVEEVNSGAVWEAWMLEQAIFKSKEKAKKAVADMKTAEVDCPEEGVDDEGDDDEADGDDDAKKPAKLDDVSKSAGDEAAAQVSGRPVRIVAGKVAPVSLITFGAKKAEAEAPLKRGRGRPSTSKGGVAR